MHPSLRNFIIFVVAVILIVGAYRYLHNKGLIKKWLNKNQTNNVNNLTNLPGKLFGPITEQRAKDLKPEQIIYWTNYHRRQNDLSDLKENQLLSLAAQEKVADMFDKQYFDHNSPTGQTPAQLVSSVGYNYKSTGENLALGDFLDEKELVNDWMASPGHRANILNKDYTEIGVASGLDQFEDRQTTWLAVQEFGKQAPVCATPATELENDINQNKQEYENLQSQYNTLTSEAKSLFEQGNAQIEQGNQIYAQTGDRTQAEPYWSEGKSLQQQAQEKNTEAQQIQNQMNSLNQELNDEVNEYNSQANIYNECIKQ